jgi:hypothetical protein
MFMLVGSVASRASKKQQSIALFITKKFKWIYMALKKIIVEVIWLHINSYMH